jgi:hypothetical protein
MEKQMKKISTVLLSSFLFLFISVSLLQAKDGQLIGKISRINMQNGEITISAPNAGETIKMGDKLYSRINNKVVIMVSTFPMMAQSKCRFVPGYKNYINSIKNGDPVYRYISGIESESDNDVVKASGSVNELAMLCGNEIRSPMIKSYMLLLGDGADPEYPSGNDFSGFIDSFTNSHAGAEIIQTNIGYMYSYKIKGVALNFESRANGLFLTEIILYNEAADGYSKYKLPLPEKLLFEDLRGDVEKKIGITKSSGGEGMIPFWAKYNSFGLKITYWSTDVKDMRNKIRYISVMKPTN